MQSVIRWLRISFRTGAVVDASVGAAMLVPKLWGFALNLPGFDPDMQHRIDLAVGASLMFSWAALLLWADRRPMERKGVLLLTLFPALTCLIATEVVAIAIGATSLQNMLPLFVMQGLLIALFGISWVRAGCTSCEMHKTI